METLLIEPKNNGQTIDLDGKEYERVTIRSKPNQQTRDITIKNGVVRRMVLQADKLWYSHEASFQQDYLQSLYANAPKNIHLDKINFAPRGDNGAIYTHPGISNLYISGCNFTGVSESISIYLNSECRNINISGNSFLTKTGREHIAIDGAYNVRVMYNTVDSYRGFVHLYRNCGEGGRNRWNQPKNCVIEHNHINLRSWWQIAIWMNSRPERRCYCIDKNSARKIPETSSMDWRSMPHTNLVKENSFSGGKPKDYIWPSPYANEIIGNHGDGDTTQPTYGVKHKIYDTLIPMFWKWYC